MNKKLKLFIFIIIIFSIVEISSIIDKTYFSNYQKQQFEKGYQECQKYIPEHISNDIYSQSTALTAFNDCTNKQLLQATQIPSQIIIFGIVSLIIGLGLIRATYYYLYQYKS